MTTSIISTSTSISTLSCPPRLPPQSQSPPFYDDDDDGKGVFFSFLMAFYSFFQFISFNDDLNELNASISTSTHPPQLPHQSSPCSLFTMMIMTVNRVVIRRWLVERLNAVRRKVVQIFVYCTCVIAW